MNLRGPQALTLQSVVRGDARVSPGAERFGIVDDVAGILVADEEAAPEEVHDGRALRGHARWRSIDIEREVLAPPLPKTMSFSTRRFPVSGACP